MSQKKRRIYPEKFYTALFWTLSALTLLGMLWLNHSSNRVSQFDGQTAYPQAQWYFGEKGSVLSPTRLEDRHLFEQGKTYEITTKLSYNGDGDAYPSAFITSGNCEIQAFLDGKLVFSHTNAEKTIPTVQSVGTVVFSVPLGENCAGRELRLELRTPMEHDSVRRLPDVYLGDHATQIRAMILDNLPSAMISCIILFAVIVLVVLSNRADGSQWTYIYFSVFAVLVVTYRAMQNVLLIYLWGNPFVAILLEYFSMAACPIPLLVSYRYRVKPYNQMGFDILIATSFALLCVENILHFTGVVDVIDMLLFTHLWILVSSLGLLALGGSARKKLENPNIFRKMVPILVGTCLDIAYYYYQRVTEGPGSFYSIGDFVGLGVFFSLIFMIWEARKSRLEAYKESERNKILEKLAYVDVLTGIRNRAAFSRAISEIEEGQAEYDAVLVVSADLNGLKKTNDRLGHAAGDRLIQRAAELMQAVFEPYGQVYRTGGDEFFAILYNVEEDRWPELRKALYAELEHRNENEEIPLSMAVGYGALEGRDMTRCVQISDDRMYAHKCTFPEHETLSAVRG